MLEKLLPPRPPGPEHNDEHEEVELHVYHSSGAGADSEEQDEDDMQGPKMQCAHQWLRVARQLQSVHCSLTQNRIS